MGGCQGNSLCSSTRWDLPNGWVKGCLSAQLSSVCSFPRDCH